MAGMTDIFKMQFNGFGNKMDNLVFCFCGGNTTGQIGHISTVTVFPFFNNDGIFHGLPLFF